MRFSVVVAAIVSIASAANITVKVGENAGLTFDPTSLVISSPSLRRLLITPIFCHPESPPLRVMWFNLSCQYLLPIHVFLSELTRCYSVAKNHVSGRHMLHESSVNLAGAIDCDAVNFCGPM